MDKKVICKSCGKEFLFTEQEQEYFNQMGFENEPLHCIKCRKQRKETRKQEKDQRQPKKIKCKSCGKEFLFTAKEEEHLKSKGLKEIPCHCLECRKKRREKRNSKEKYIK